MIILASSNSLFIGQIDDQKMKNLTGCAKVTRLQYSESYREKAASIPKSSLIVPGRPFKPLSGVELNQIVSYIQTGGEAILVWLTWDIKSIIVFIMGPMNSPEGKAISMASSPSGHLQKGG